jgi:O-antigen/teichoic acid export membrane protein
MSDINPLDRSLGAEALSGTTARVTLLIIGFLGTVVFARVLGAEGFGAFYLLVTLENLADRPISGWAKAAKKRLSEEGTDPERIYGTFFSVFVAFVLLVVAVAAVLSGHVDAYAGQEGAWVLFVMMFLALASQDTFNTLLSSTGQIGLTNWIDAFRSLLTIPAQVALVLLGFGVAGMTYGLAGASFVTAAMILWYIDLSPARPDRETVRSMWRFARFSIPSLFTRYGYQKLGFLLVGVLLGPEVAGYFEAAQKLTIPAVMLGGMAGGVLMPQLSNLSSQGEDVADKVREVLAYSSLLAIPILFGAAAFPRQIAITVFGSEFARAGPILLGYALYRVIRSRTVPLRSAFRGLDRPDAVLYITLGAAVVLVGLGLPMLDRYGPEGIIAAMIVSEGVWYVLAMTVLRREHDVPWLPRPVSVQVLAGVVMFAVVEAVQRFVGLDPWYMVFVTIGLGASVYFAVLFGVSREIRRTVRFVLEDFVEEKVPFPLPLGRGE